MRTHTTTEIVWPCRHYPCELVCADRNTLITHLVTEHATDPRQANVDAISFPSSMLPLPTRYRVAHFQDVRPRPAPWVPYAPSEMLSSVTVEFPQLATSVVNLDVEEPPTREETKMAKTTRCVLCARVFEKTQGPQKYCEDCRILPKCSGCGGRGSRHTPSCPRVRKKTKEAKPVRKKPTDAKPEDTKEKQGLQKVRFSNASTHKQIAERCEEEIRTRRAKIAELEAEITSLRTVAKLLA